MVSPVRALVVVLAFVPAIALGCEEGTDARPWAEKLVEAPVIFAGMVTALADANGRVLGDPPGKCGDDPLVPCGAAPSVLSAAKVVFAVETPIRGVTGDTMLVEQGEVTDCQIAFEIGQRWLFAGTFIGGGSMQLDGKRDEEVADLMRQAQEAIR